MKLELAVELFLKRFEATDNINDRDLIRLQREMSNALERQNTENADLRNRLQQAESRAAAGDAMAAYVLDCGDDYVTRQFVGGALALVEARS